MLRVQGKANPVPITEVRTGEYVQCLRTDDDMMLPKTLDWCLVANW